MLLCRCFECVSYSHSLRIRVNGSNWPMCHCIHNPQWTQSERVSSVLIIAVHSISEWMELTNVSWYLQSTLDTIWRCFECVDYSHSLHIRVNGTNRPMCHGICNLQWTQYEGISSWSIAPVHSVSEWMELIDQCVTVSATHSGHNFFTQYAVHSSSNAWYVLNTGLILMSLYRMAR